MNIEIDVFQHGVGAARGFIHFAQLLKAQECQAEPSTTLSRAAPQLACLLS